MVCFYKDTDQRNFPKIAKFNIFSEFFRQQKASLDLDDCIVGEYNCIIRQNTHLRRVYKRKKIKIIKIYEFHDGFYKFHSKFKLLQNTYFAMKQHVTRAERCNIATTRKYGCNGSNCCQQFAGAANGRQVMCKSM